MSFDWVEFVRLAQRLIENQDEASLRSAISRAYYGVFCIARNVAGFESHREQNVHKQVIEYYKNSDDSQNRYIGHLLDELRRNRNKADYNEDVLINRALAQRVLIKAKKVLNKLGVQV